jgi:hypothetical protein
VSNPDGSGYTGYSTNKLSVNQLKEFINGGTGFGGYEIIDTSEDGNGIYTAETIS